MTVGRVNEEAQLCPDQLGMGSLGGEVDEFVGLFSTDSILRDELLSDTNDNDAEEGAAAVSGDETPSPSECKPPPRKKQQSRRLHVTPRRDPISSRACGPCGEQRTDIVEAVGKAIKSATQEKPSFAELPHGWEMASDPRSGKVFYLNHLTKTTQWEPPTPTSRPHSSLSTSAGTKLGLTENSSTSIYFKKSCRGGRSVQFNARDAYNSSEQVRCIQNLVRSKRKGTVKALSTNNGGFGSDSTVCKRKSNQDSKHSQPDSKKRRHAAVAPASKTLKRGVVRRGDRKSNGTRWDVNCEALAEFKELHGHTNVPQKMGQLGKWVNNARQEYRKKERGNRSSLTKERIKQLDDMGFNWVASKGVSRDDRNATTTKKEVKERIVTLDGRRVRETIITVTTTTIRRETLEEKDSASVTVEGRKEPDDVIEELET